MTTATTSSSSKSSSGGDMDFGSSGGTLVDFDDGHVPETFKSVSGSSTKLVRYPQHASSTTSIHVHDNVLPKDVVQALYETTTDLESPWGAYVTLEEAKKYWERSESISSIVDERHEDSLSVQAAAYFFNRIMSGTPIYKSSDAPLFSSWQDLYRNDVHGVAVWALASDVSSQVLFHLDYAELIRYQHNVIVPPLFAGTIQCSQGKMTGGDFAVQLKGLSHYEDHGYKGIKSGDEWAGWTQPSLVDTVDSNKDTSWITIPYRFNRAICHTGHLPHLSTPIEALEEGHKRVILGFNVFCNDVGPFVQQAPEHSNAFRRRIQLHRSLLKRQSASSVSIEHIRKSKGLTKLLVLAKREKVKQQLRQSQRQLDNDVDEMVAAAGMDGVRLATVMEKLAKTDGSWPNRVDVQVHLHHRVSKAADSSQSNKQDMTIRIRCKRDPVTDRENDAILPADTILYPNTCYGATA